MKKLKLGFKKYLKGMLGIFIIKLFIIALVLINQACETEESLPNENIRENFMYALRISSDKIAKIKVDKGIYGHGTLTSRTTNFGLVEVKEDETNICTKTPIEPINTIDPVNSDEPNVISLVDFTSIELKPIEEGDPDGNDFCYSFNNNEVVQALSPAVLEAKNYLYIQGLSDADIDEIIFQEVGTAEDLIPLVMTMIKLEETESETAYNFSSMFFTSANAQSWNDVGQCALAAIGADVIWSLGSDGGKWTKKAIKKAFGAVAKRLLGPIGVAIAVVTFGICMANAALTDA